jgi:glycosyltransferase involved in cell wall biosynthesis
VHIILDVHSTDARVHKADYQAGDVFNLVWEGLPCNVTQLYQIQGVLAKLKARRKMALHLITDLEFQRYMGRYGRTQTVNLTRGLCDRVYLYSWNEQMCSSIVCASDLAVIPIDLNDPFLRGKPENKLLLFWRMGMPTVTSATPAYDRAMAKAGLSMTCRSEDDWVSTIEKYVADEVSRREAGLAGRAFAESEYSEEAILRRWDQLLESILYTC